MADEQDNPKRPRPASPAIPPFRGGAQRAPSSLGGGKSAPPFVGSRPASSPPRSPNDSAAAASGAAPPARPASRPAPVPAAPVPTAPVPADADRSRLQPESWGTYQPPALPRAARDAHPAAPAESQQPSAELPWLDTSAGELPATAQPLPFPPFDTGAGEAAGPEETAQALAGLPYFDGDGDQHSGREPAAARGSGKMHRVEFDVADVLERIASRIRDGDLAVTNVDPVAGEGAALAAVLAALLRQRGR